ncbi:transposable element Tcb2 transposase [Trichonephila clavipes]|nr:transposable element Tcb2 transposase [Trichonephila clavipes]
MLGRRIAAHQPPPTCLPELRRALLDDWCNIPQDKIDNLILSMPRRWKACGDHGLQHFRDIALAAQCTGNAYYRGATVNPIPPQTMIPGARPVWRCMMQELAASQHESPNSNPITVMLQTEAGFVI